MRLISVFLFLLFFFQTGANAQVDEHCEGKYRHAAELVNSAFNAYGTLYSGGDYFFSTNGNVSSTIDLYRFWRGYADIKLREHRPIVYEVQQGLERSYWSKLSAVDLWTNGAWALSDAAPKQYSNKQLVDAALGFDLLTSGGGEPDWWLAPDERQRLGPRSKWVQYNSKTKPFLDWLQTSYAATSAPWSIHWHLEPSRRYIYDYGYVRIFEHAWKRYKAGDGVEWAAVAALNVPAGLEYENNRGIVELHNGSVTVQSEVDKGTTFTVKIPAPNSSP